jgi:hypothetical protein
MDPDESVPDAVDEGQTPPDAEGKTPDTESADDSAEGKKPERTFDAAFVRGLRAEAKANRERYETAEQKLAEIAEEGKSELEKLTERVQAAERLAEEKTTQVLRYEIAAAHGLDLADCEFLTGNTREEIEERADAFVKRVAERTQQRPAVPQGFDGGVRDTAPVRKAPELEHNESLLQLMGRRPAG